MRFFWIGLAGLLLVPSASRGEDRVLDWVKVTDRAGWQPRDSSGEVAFRDRLWIMGGWFDSFSAPPRDVWSSPDGKTWDLITREAPWKHSDLPMTAVFDDRIWLLGGWYNGRLPGHGASNEVWSSRDGKTWEPATSHAGWSPRLAGGVVSFKGRLWILGGTENYYFGDDNSLKNDVWSSADGKEWRREVANAPWLPRAYHATVVHDGKIWVLGGGNYVPRYEARNDVWCSSDGVHWEQVAEHAAWPPRIWFSAAVYRDRIWVLGGWTNNPSKNLGDVWYSRDGKEWTPLRSNVVWKERHEHSTYVFQDKLWVAGGHARPLNSEVWSLDVPRDWFAAPRAEVTTSRPAASVARSQPGGSKATEIALTLQTREPATGTIQWTAERVDPHRVGVIAVDVWNYHWCKTATMRVDAFVPRIDRALDAARELGMTVMLCPSDVVDNYVGYPQREAVLALPKVEVPSLIDVTCPPVPDARGCERCAGNYGWDGMHPGLRIGPDDLMPDTQAEVYAICRKKRLTHLIYVGFHTQVCLLGKPMGLKAMKSAGLKCVLARDMTDAHPGYDPTRGFTPDLNTAQVIEHFEKHLAPTIHFQEELTKLGRWDPRWVMDPVRIAPWGTSQRPHLFEQPIIVTLSVPFQPGAEIRYTLDGSAPTEDSPKYNEPLTVADTTHLRASAFRNGRAVCRESEGAFFRMAPMPPLPDVHLGDLAPIRSVGFGHTYGGKVRYSGNTRAPQKDRSNLGQDIRINRKQYRHGIGMHAPCELVYEIKPGYARFVGLAGAD